MRYLWVEDFDGGRTGQTELKKSLEKYFQLTGNTENYRTLESVLFFLDNPESWRLFDAVLIDIRFRICERENDENKIYQKYFSSFLTEEKYKEYSKKVNNDPDSASAGVLLYLALVHRYNYNQNRIAFLSANIEDSSGKVADFNNMLEFVMKARYEKLSPADKDRFSLANEAAYCVFKEELNLSDKEAEDEFLPATDDINWDNLDSLEEKIKVLKERVKKNVHIQKHEKKENLKYNSVKEEFQNIGLIVPQPFSKPEGAGQADISWMFFDWVNRYLNTDYYRLRAALMPVCLSIEKMGDNISLKDSKIYSIEDVREVISDIILLMPENGWVDDTEWLFARILKECAKIADRIDKSYFNNQIVAYEYGCRAVLKIVRNWTSHQGIPNITAFDVVFVFTILIDTIIHLDECDDAYCNIKKLLKEYCKCTKDINAENIIRKSEEKYNEVYLNLPKTKEKEEYQKQTNFYKKISGIGNEDSTEKNNVNMDMIYCMFLVLIGENYENSKEILVNELVAKLSK